MGMNKGQAKYGKIYTEKIFTLHYEKGKTTCEMAESFLNLYTI